MRSAVHRGLVFSFRALGGMILYFSLSGCFSHEQIRSICDLQGAGPVSPYRGQELTTQGVVVAVRERGDGGGFFLQDEGCDGDRETSDGIYVVHTGQPVKVGEELRVTGRVEEVGGQTVLRAVVGRMDTVSVGHTLPEPVPLEPVLSREISAPLLEHWEGMLVSVQGGTVAGSGQSRDQILFIPFPDARGKQGSEADLVGPMCLVVTPELDLKPPLDGGDRLGYITAALEEIDGDYCLYPLHRLEIVRAGPALPVIPDEVERDFGGGQEPRTQDSLPSAPYQEVSLEWFRSYTPAPTPHRSPTPTPTPYPGKLLISEVYPNPQGEEPAGEWIEIYNPGTVARQLTNYKIGDAEVLMDREGMLLFPPGYYIEKGEVLVIARQGKAFFAAYGRYPDFEIENTLPEVQDMWKYGGWGGSNLALGNRGDEILFLDWEDRIVDSVAYGESDFKSFQPSVPSPAEGHSLERYPPRRDKNHASDWREREDPSPGWLDRTANTPAPTATPTVTASVTPTLTPTGPTPTPVPVSLLISEVGADPAGPEPGGEWVEIYNPRPYAIPLDGVKVGDGASAGDPEGMMAFPSGEEVKPGGVILLANRGAAFQARFGFLPDYEFYPSHPAVPELSRYSSWSTGSVRLRNEGDQVLILDAGDRVVDMVAYGDSIYPGFQPPVKRAGEGETLQRYPPGADSGGAGDWRVSGQPSPGALGSPSPTLTPTSTLSPTPAPVPVPLLVSEVLADPASPGSAGEWIEIYHPGAFPFLLDGVKVGDAARAGAREGMLIFPPGAVVQPGEVLVVAQEGAHFAANYGFLPHYEIRDTLASMPDMEKYASWSSYPLRLRDGGDEVLILDGQDRVVDVLAYGDSSYPGFQPPVKKPGEGHSLERYPPFVDHHNARDWREQEHPSPGRLAWNTPTPTSSVTPTPAPTNTTTLTPSPTFPPSSTPTLTMTATLTATSPPPPTSTHTPTPLDSPTPSPGATSTPSLTATVEPSLTSTAGDASPTPSPTETETPLSHPTATLTPTPLPTLIVLNEIHADPHPLEGDANGDGERDSREDEFLEFVNVSGASLDLGGWTVYDGVARRHTFPAGTILRDHCPLLLFGGGSPSGSFGGSVVQTAGALGLNNGGDTVTLYDDRGRVRAHTSYGSGANHDQSLTRDPDLWGRFVRHTAASAGVLYSPGVGVRGAPFGSCP